MEMLHNISRILKLNLKSSYELDGLKLRITEMKVVIFLFLVATAFCQEIAQAEEGLMAEALDETEDEVEVEVRDENGNLISQSEIFTHDDFQVEKSVNNSVCVIKNKNDTSACYKEKPLTFEIPSSIWAYCEDREITILEAIECQDDLGQEGHVGDEIVHRRKRSVYTTLCLWEKRTSTYCASDRCCQYGWFFGKNTCKRRCCTQYESRVIWTRKCITGYTSRF